MKTERADLPTSVVRVFIKEIFLFFVFLVWPVQLVRDGLVEDGRELRSSDEHQQDQDGRTESEKFYSDYFGTFNTHDCLC